MSQRSSRHIAARTMSAAIRRAMIAMVLGAGVAAPVVVATPARAQSVATSYYAVVTADKTPLLCFNTETSYAVAELKQGQIVRVFADGPRFAAVAYPAGQTAFVRADEVVIEGNTAKLVKPSQLRAASLTGGFGRSWKALMPSEAPIASGTVLTLAEPSIEQENGVTVAYRVIAPEGARAWIDSRNLRRATEQEAAAANLPALAAKPETKPEPDAKPETKPETKTAQNPDAPAGMSPVPPSKTTLAEPTTPGATPGVRPATGLGASPAGPVTRPAERRLASAENLEAMFNEVRQKPMSAEIDELMAEYSRMIDATPVDSGGRRRGLESRLEVLKTMKDYREMVLKREAERRQLDANEIKLRDIIAEFERTRIYTILGVLQPSTVYDGKRLPLMYRIQTVGGSTPRTLGYIRPTPDLRLEEKLGLIVGVIGESQMDDALRLNVINAVRVDTLRAGDSPAAPEGTKPISDSAKAKPAEAPKPAEKPSDKPAPREYEK